VHLNFQLPVAGVSERIVGDSVPAVKRSRKSNVRDGRPLRPSHEPATPKGSVIIPIIESLNALLRTPPDREAFRRYLETAAREPLLRHDKLLRELADVVSLDWSQTQRIHMARLLESRSLLADVMVRTRKREAFPNRVVRKPWVLQVRLSPEEQQLYESLSDRIRRAVRREHPGTPGEFVLIGRQRQLASRIPAALAAWRKSGHLDELLWEDLGTELGEAGDRLPEVAFEDLISEYNFEAGDSKYKEFSQAISQHLRDIRPRRSSYSPSFAIRSSISSGGWKPTEFAAR
jgi:hypothetical protein